MDVDERLAQARLLVEQLEAGNAEEAERIIDEISIRKEPDLFQEVGRLTRELHEAINGFLLDQRIAEMAEHEIPDASERLSYVVEMTEKSANKTLNAVEHSLPLADELKKMAEDLSAQWELFRGRQLSVEDFRTLSDELSAFFKLTTEHSGQLHTDLSQVLLAQDFQDLTGQIIRQVIALVHDVEEKLVQLVKISGAHLPEMKQHKDKLEGPVIPTINQGDVVTGQDEVDDLLSSLGF